MNIRFGLTVLGRLLGSLDVHIELDQAEGQAPFVDRTVKGITKKWVEKMTS